MLLSACLLTLCAAVPADDPVQIESAHYDLVWDGARADAADASKMLEAAFRELGVFFSAQPKDRLRVLVMRDEGARREAAWDDGTAVPAHNRAAWFSEQTRSAYVARGAGPQSDRAALLYAACIQFHSLAKAKNLDAARAWQASGIALDFARSPWDGARLSAFEAPRVEAVDLVERALLALGTDGAQLAALDSAEAGDVSLHWAVAALCLHGGDRTYRSVFQRHAVGDSGSKVGSADFLRALGPKAKLVKDLRAFLPRTRTPFEPFGDWEDRGAGGIVARPRAGNAVHCVLREGCERLTARIAPLPRTGARAGFVAGWGSTEDCALLDVEAPEVIVRVTRLGRAVATRRLPIPGDAGRERTVELSRAGSQYVLVVDGVRFAELELPSGRMGFFASGADVAFRDVTWR